VKENRTIREIRVGIDGYRAGRFPSNTFPLKRKPVLKETGSKEKGAEKKW
jgi:hypothetical protein